jgi:esterase/lipase
MQHPAPKQWDPSAAIPIAAGLYAMLAEDNAGWLFFAGIPGALVLMAGLALLLMRGDARVTAYMALGSGLGVLLAIPAAFSGGFGQALVAAILFGMSFVTSGRIALRDEPPPLTVPRPENHIRLQAKAALDELLLGYFVGSASLPSGAVAERMCAEAKRLPDLIQRRGWATDLDLLHVAPPLPTHVRVQTARTFGYDYERVSFESGWVPDPELPGAEAWRTLNNNGTAVANVFRHPGPPRPWLVCIHGYRMGTPMLDLSLFPPGRLHHQLGLNVLMPTLPLHGPRKLGRRTGDRYLDGNLLDLIAAQCQALWDLRRWLAWLREVQQAPAIGVCGVSLGGYNAALLSQYVSYLDFVMATVPVIDLADTLYRFIPAVHRRYFEENGLDIEAYRRMLHLVSPTARPSLVPQAHRHIVGAIADRVVLPRNPIALSEHWGVPVNWYQGSHLSVRGEEVVDRVLDAAMRAAWPDAVLGSY